MSIQDYQCPDCGATSTDPAYHCCDTCILKFYFGNPNASTFDERLDAEKDSD